MHSPSSSQRFRILLEHATWAVPILRTLLGAFYLGASQCGRLQGLMNSSSSVHAITRHVCRVVDRKRRLWLCTDASEDWHEPYAANCDVDDNGTGALRAVRLGGKHRQLPGVGPVKSGFQLHGNRRSRGVWILERSATVERSTTCPPPVLFMLRCVRALHSTR